MAFESIAPCFQGTPVAHTPIGHTGLRGEHIPIARDYARFSGVTTPEIDFTKEAARVRSREAGGGAYSFMPPFHTRSFDDSLSKEQEERAEERRSERRWEAKKRLEENIRDMLRVNEMLTRGSSAEKGDSDGTQVKIRPSPGFMSERVIRFKGDNSTYKLYAGATANDTFFGVQPPGMKHKDYKESLEFQKSLFRPRCKD